MNKLSWDDYTKLLEDTIRNYALKLSDDDLLKMNNNHFDAIDYGMLVDRILEQEYIRRHSNGI